MKNLIIAIVMFLTFAGAAHAQEAEFSFSWTVQPDLVSSQNITELRVYQDSSENTVGTVDPLSGKIIIHTDVEECSNFWATYATETDESDRTEEIVACVPDKDDPLPSQKVVSVNGLKVTIEFDPEKWVNQ